MRQRTVSLWMNTEVAPDALYYMAPITSHRLTSHRFKLADFDAHIMRLEPRLGRHVPPSRKLVADRGAEARVSRQKLKRFPADLNRRDSQRARVERVFGH